MARYDFASDNTAPAAPEAIEALVAANTGFTSGYGTDAVSARAADARQVTWPYPRPSSQAASTRLKWQPADSGNTRFCVAFQPSI